MSPRNLLLAALIVWGGPARAAEPGASSSETAAHPAAPNVVALWIDGSLAPERRTSLERVVRAELAPDAVTLEVDASHAPLSLFIRQVAHEPRVLIAAALQSDELGWRLYLLHVARGRTMERRLPGGADADAAALEAVATILESAISALRDGVELGEPGSPLAPTDTDPAPAPPPPKPSATPEGAPATSADASPSFGVLGGVGASVAALGGGLVPGGNASLALRTGEHLALRLAAALYVPEAVTSPYGSFRYQRTTLDLRAASPLAARPFTLTPELGGVLELVRRSSAAPGPGVIASSDANLVRGGALVGARLSYPVSSWVLLELGVRVECFTRATHFVAGGTPKQSIFSLEPVVPVAELGLVLGKP